MINSVSASTVGERRRRESWRLTVDNTRLFQSARLFEAPVGRLSLLTLTTFSCGVGFARAAQAPIIKDGR